MVILLMKKTSQFSSFLLIFSRFPICFGFSGVASFSTVSN